MLSIFNGPIKNGWVWEYGSEVFQLHKVTGSMVATWLAFRHVAWDQAEGKEGTLEASGAAPP